ncbi:MAG: hypothetical protein LUE10_03780, partial [Alistipes sp.]|nr:hypothetical protein [Alistipes sp.]
MDARICPRCKNRIGAAAGKCRWCGEPVENGPAAPVRPAPVEGAAALPRAESGPDRKPGRELLAQAMVPGWLATPIPAACLLAVLCYAFNFYFLWKAYPFPYHYHGIINEPLRSLIDISQAGWIIFEVAAWLLFAIMLRKFRGGG